MSQKGPRKLTYEEAVGGPAKTGGELKFFLQDPHLTCGIFKLKPGERLVEIPLKHKSASVEVYYVLKGTVWVDIVDPSGKRTFEVKEGEFFQLPSGMEHIPHNKGREEASVLFAATIWP